MTKKLKSLWQILLYLENMLNEDKYTSSVTSVYHSFSVGKRHLSTTTQTKSKIKLNNTQVGR